MTNNTNTKFDYINKFDKFDKFDYIERFDGFNDIEEINLSIELGKNKIKFDNCIYNASGPRCTNYDELDKLLNSNSSAILSKSCTLESREGNKGVRYWDSSNILYPTNNYFSLNSMGLPNNGYIYYIDYLDKLYLNNITKPYIISVAGLSLDDNIKIIKTINEKNGEHKNRHSDSSVKIGIELNLSCPNIIGKGQLAYDFNQLENYLINIFKLDMTNIDIFGVKLPPYFELNHFEIVANILNKFPIDFITCINSVPNALVIDLNTDKSVIEPKNGLGGLGGNIIKPISLSNVYNFKKLLPNIDIIGCGGVKTGSDVYEMILCGASAVQIGTQYMIEDINCFSRIENELKQFMLEKGKNQIDDIKSSIIKKKIKLKIKN